MKGFAVENLPRILRTYLFCCPALDGNLRCLPRAGGYYDQDHVDMLGFKVIEDRVNNIRQRKADAEKYKKEQKERGHDS